MEKKNQYTTKGRSGAEVLRPSANMIVVTVLVLLSLLISAVNVLAGRWESSADRAAVAEILGGHAYTTETQHAGFYHFDPAVPGTLNLIGAYTDPVWAGEFDNSGDSPTLYVINDETTNLEALDTTTGLSTIIGPTGNGDTSGMATDPTDGSVYVNDTPTCGTGSRLHTLDLSTGALSLVGDISNTQCVMAIAFDDSGQLYGLDILLNALILIDKSDGSGTVVALNGLGFDPIFFNHGMDYDPVTATMILASYNGSNFTTELRSVDLATGSTTLIGVLGSDSPGGSINVGWLATPSFPTGGNFRVFLPLILKDG